MDNKQIKEIFSDKEFVTSLLQIEEPKEVQEILKGKGLDLTIEDIKKIGDLLNRAMNNELTDSEKKIFESYASGDVELSDDALESVSGGIIITITLMNIITYAALAGLGGMGIGAVGFGAAKTHQATNGKW